MADQVRQLRDELERATVVAVPNTASRTLERLCLPLLILTLLAVVVVICVRGERSTTQRLNDGDDPLFQPFAR